MKLRTRTIFLSLVLTASVVSAQTTPASGLLQQAANAYTAAQQANKVLSEKPQAEQTRSEVLKVVNAYERVYMITPHTSYADDALVAVARLYESIKDYPAAVKTLNFLVHEYPQSPFKAAATRDITRLGGSDSVSSTPEVRAEAKTDAKTDAKPSATVTIENIKYWEAEKSVRVVVDLSGEISFKQGEAKSPDRVFIDIAHAKLTPALVNKVMTVNSGLLQKIRIGQNEAGTVRIVLDVNSMLRATSFSLRDPNRLVIDVLGEPDNPAPVSETPSRRVTEAVPPSPPVTKQASASTTTSSTPKAAAATKSSSPAKVPAADPNPQMATTAQRSSQGNRSLIRSLGLKVGTVVIDAGHGGHDTGSIGPSGYMEKELVLDVATRLKDLIESEIGSDVVMTRSDDTFIPLETRTAIANQQKADLFISIHANSSNSKTVRGVETFFLNFTTSQDSLDTAARENASTERSVHELGDIVKKIVLSSKVDESRELAQRVQSSMSRGRDFGPDRGVKQAPFVVLIGANMPAILAEISFISNPDEEKSLKSPEYRQQIAESLLRGVRSYADTLSSVRTAKSIDKN